MPVEQWRRNRATAVASSVLIDTAYYLMVPAMPQFVRLLGVTAPRQVTLWVGLLIGIAPVISGFVGPLWGRLADRQGLKIHALRTTLALSCIYFLSSLCGSVWAFLPLRVLLGFAGGYQSLVVALATQLCPARRTAAVIGSVQIGQIVAAASAPVVGGLLTAAIGIRRTLMVSSLLCLIAFTLYALNYRDAGSRREPEREAAPERARLWSLPHFAALAAMIFLVTVIDKNLLAMVPLFVLAHSADPWRAARVAGLVLSLAAVGDTVAVWFCGRRVGRASLRPLLAARWTCGAALCCGLALCRAVLPFALLRVLLALLAGGTLTVAYAMASSIIPPRQRATGFAFLSSCALIGAGVGPLVLSALASRGLHAVFVADAVFYSALVAIALARLRPTRKSASAAP